LLALAIALLSLAGMDTARAQPAATGQFGAASSAEPLAYLIRPLDRITIRVLGAPELSFERIQVDASGRLSFPLVGDLVVAGRTASEVAADLGARLERSYLRSPSVTVIVDERSAQHISVQGAVSQAGYFEISSRTTLADALAMARGLSRTADLRRVAIIRTVEGQPRAAIFDLREIYAGRATNPEVLPDDIVVVADSRSLVLWRSMVESLPAFAIFSTF
jgi:polysaccharide export outer membrane protein